MKSKHLFQSVDLGGGYLFWVGKLPAEFVWNNATFEEVWKSHPEEFHTIMIHGKPVKTPRWQQAYARDYHYTGRVNPALPITPTLAPLMNWVKEAIDERLNGLLLNWYEGTLGHYIGKHRDSRIGLVEGGPIVTMSFGEQRTFRLRPWDKERRSEKTDFPATDGTVFVMPYDTNLMFTHEVPAPSGASGRRVSVTARAFTS